MKRAVTLSLTLALLAASFGQPAEATLGGPGGMLPVDGRSPVAKPVPKRQARPARPVRRAKPPAKKVPPPPALPPSAPVVLVPADPNAPFAMASTHLSIGLLPSSRSLRALARLTLTPQAAGLETLKLRLHAGLKVTRVTVNQRPVRFVRSGEALTVAWPKAYKVGQKAVVGVVYAGRPQEVLNQKTLQDVGPDAVVLHPKGRWYPTLPESRPTPASVEVSVPPRWQVAGPASRVSGRGQRFKLDFAQPGPLAVVAGPYQVFHTAGLTTYTFPKTTVVSELSRGAALLSLYRSRGLSLGGATSTLIELPENFRAVVLPGWQARVRTPGGLDEWVALAQWTPANPAASARVEQQWLGTSLVHFTQDLLAEKAGGKAGYANAMKRHLDQYQEFLRRRPTADVPLNQAIAPGAEAWEPVVGHKGALIWGMVRDAIGDVALWEALKQHQARLATNTATLTAFHEQTGRPTAFVYSWLANAGLPVLKLRGVQVQEEEGRYQVSGTLVQRGPAFQVPLEMLLVGQEANQRLTFQSFAGEMPFHFVTESRPLRLAVDPRETAPVWRQTDLLIAEGVSPIDGVLVYGTLGTTEETQANLAAAREFQERLRKTKNLYLPIRSDQEVPAEERRRSLLLFGHPGTNALAAEFADQFPVRFPERKAIWWQGRTYTRPQHGTVQVIANPADPNQTVVLFAGLSPKATAATLAFTERLATFCVFEGDEVLAEGRTMRPFPDLGVVLY